VVKYVLLYSLRLLVVCCIGASLWFTGLVLFTSIIPSAPPQTVITTDGIAIFTGGKTRLHVALDLFQQQKGNYLLISGVNPDSTLPQVIKTLPHRDHITLDYNALDTHGNAEQTAKWASQYQIKTLRLITSNYHMPRSLLELRVLLPRVDIIPHPVVGRRFLNPKWWLDPLTLCLVIEEYNKFLFALVRRPIKDLKEILTLQGKA
jgi:uncharacterized SAM-binding protein YcdF (DUF218 family)